MKYFLHAFGCRVNQCEMDELRARLAASGGRETRDLGEADVCVVNTCTVTRDADRQALKFMRRVVRQNPKARLVATGCLAALDPRAVLEAAPGARIVGNDLKEKLPEILELPAGGAEPRISRSRPFLKIQDGCDAACSYCIVPKVRPRLWSLPLADVETKVRGWVAAGAPEIVLCGVRLGRYGAETDLAGLLERLLKIPGDFRLRLSSLEIGEASDRLAGLMAGSGGKLCPHLHLPLQSGSDSVLRRMNRPYAAVDFKKKVAAWLRRVPGLAIFTDIITGFPGETDVEFSEGLDFVRGLGLRGLHVFRYSPRPGTAAAVLPPVPATAVRKRLEAWRELDASLRRAHAQSAVGQERMVVPLKGKFDAVTEDFLTVQLDRKVGPGLWRALISCCGQAQIPL